MKASRCAVRLVLSVGVGMMPTLAAMSRSRSPGSWAMHSSTRAWLVRKFQAGMLALYKYLKVISRKNLLVSDCKRSLAHGHRG